MMRVVVTGLGLVTPLGGSVMTNWQRLLAGRSGLRSPRLDGAAACPAGALGQVPLQTWRRIQAAFPAQTRTGEDRRTLFALWAAAAALKDAGFTVPFGSAKRCGVAAAAGLGSFRLEDVARWIDSQGRFNREAFMAAADVHPESTLRHPLDRAASLVARYFGLEGVNSTVCSACASATQALGLAFRQIRRQEATLMVAGGSDSMTDPVSLACFLVLETASVANEVPQKVCRPFDRKRSGLVIGEGAGFVVLESFEHAAQRGARIHAEVLGYGTALDGGHVAAPHPGGEGLAYAIEAALADAGVDPGAVDYINAHGTATRPNDPAETQAIKRVFAEHAKTLMISSSKSMIGHLMAAAGGPEFIYTVLSVTRNRVHPTLNLDTPDSRCDLDYVPHAPRKRPVRVALSHSAGLGGQNAVLVVGKLSPEDRRRSKARG